MKTLFLIKALSRAHLKPPPVDRGPICAAFSALLTLKNTRHFLGSQNQNCTTPRTTLSVRVFEMRSGRSTLRRTGARSLRKNEEGAILPMGLLFALFSFGLGYAVYNMAEVVNYREKIQDRADLAAFTAATYWADRMNDLTHYSKEQMFQLQALTIAESLKDVDWECVTPPGANALANCGIKPGKMDLVYGVPPAWTSKFSHADYSSTILKGASGSVYPLCSPPNCDSEEDDAIRRALKPPGRLSTTTIKELIDPTWDIVENRIKAFSDADPEFAIRVDRNPRQSPDESRSFTAKGNTTDNAYETLRCMRWSFLHKDIDQNYVDDKLVKPVLDRVNKLIRFHHRVADEENNDANATIPAGGPVVAPCAGTVHFDTSCAYGTNCEAIFEPDDPSCAGAKVTGEFNVTMSGSGMYSSPGLPVAEGSTIGTATGSGAQPENFPLSGISDSLRLLYAWRLKERSHDEVKDRMKDVWNKMRDEGVCFLTLSRNTQRFRFLGVATSKINFDSFVRDNAKIAGVGALKEDPTAHPGYEMTPAGNFAWAQAGIGVTSIYGNSFEKAEEKLTGSPPSGQWYSVPLHEFGYRKWRPRMVRIEFRHDDHEDDYGRSHALHPDEKTSWKKTNDAFAH